MEAGDTVLIADGGDVSRAQIAQLLSDAGYLVIETDRGDEALALARSADPAAVILEVALEGLCGYEVCRELKSEPDFNAPVIFVSSTRTEPHDRIAGLLLRADDYIARPYEPGELLARLRNLIRRTRARDLGARSALTKREHEILDLMSEGLRHRDIARQLFISPKTVATHVEHILRKLGVRTSAEAVAVAYREELLRR